MEVPANMFTRTAYLAAIIILTVPVAQDDESAPAAPAAPAACYVAAQRLYNGVDRPVTILIDERAGDDERDREVALTLALLEDNGNPIVEDYHVTPGAEVDLAAEMPVIWRIRRACYLQLMRNGEPFGSALVLQPMLSRPPIWTQKEYRPDGSAAYTRIVGWGSEAPNGWREPEMRKIDTNGDGEPDTLVPIDQLEDPTPEIEPEVFSGLRIFPERDVILHTSHGDIRVALTPEEAPNTAWNFVELAEGGFYDDLIFHRIVPIERHGHPFVIQGGDPTGEGSGGPGYWLPLEPSNLPHQFGVISMARADDPDSAGSQFFFCLSREGTARLDGQYCAFGFAVQGAKTIRDIASVALADAARGRPAEPPLIIRAEVIPAPPRIPGEWRWLTRVEEDDEGEEEAPIRVPR